jgi:signal transduction histidine kinase
MTNSSGLSPEKRLIQAGRRIRDALRSMRDSVRKERKNDLYNKTFAELDGAIEEATDGLIELSNIFEIVISRTVGANITYTAGDADNLRALQEDLASMKTEREGLINDLQAAQQQLQRFADDLQTLYKKEREKRAELDLAYERLKVADRLKSGFLGTVTHELSSPLVPIDFSLQLVEKGDLTSEQQQALGKVKTHLGQYRKQLDGLIKYANLVSQSQVIDPQPFNVKAMLDHALQPLLMLADGRDIELSVQPFSPDLTLTADKELLGSALYQLVHNGIKFNKAGGHVYVAVIEEDSGLLFQISDDGDGIPDKVLQSFGQDFNQIVDSVKRGVEGLGLGLAMANYVASAHKGNLAAITGTQQGRGTVVQLRIPYKN